MVSKIKGWVFMDEDENANLEGNGKPNSWSPVILKNEWGCDITDVTLSHRYDTDWYDTKDWPIIPSGGTGTGLRAGYWTGTFRTGKDYWHITFKAVNSGVWSCKDNFYCFLTKSDKDDTVTITVKPKKMHVEPPKSSSCDVGLSQVGAEEDADEGECENCEKKEQ